MKVPNASLNISKMSNALNHIARSIRTLIIHRTGSGVDVKRTPFKAYSPQYAKYKSGLSKSARVDLRDTGKMLQSLKVDKKIKKSVIYIGEQNRSDIGWYHQTGKGRQPERYWFGINQADADKIFLRTMPSYKIARFV